MPIIGDVIAGYESTVFAYGQTGTGKTFTMEGNVEVSDDMGIIPRAATKIFQQISSGKYKDSSVSVSYLEIYNEELCDLLVETPEPGNERVNKYAVGAKGPTGPKLQLAEEKTKDGKRVSNPNPSV